MTEEKLPRHANFYTRVPFCVPLRIAKALLRNVKYDPWLAIADRVVRLHQGSIEAYNARGGGLAIDIHLPLLGKGG